MGGSHLDIDGHRIAVSHLDRVLYPQTQTRKYDVIEYFLAVADGLLPHLTDRPITRKRWPAGTGSAVFFEKALPAGAPEWIARFTIEHRGESKAYPVARSRADLVWLGQLAALELHVPQWRIALAEEGARRTDRIVFDLDPGMDVPLTQCAQVALTIREVLAATGLSAYPVTSGGNGIHVYAALPAPVKATSAAAVAKQVALDLAAQAPGEITAAMSRSGRTGKVFIDWSQNNPAKTTLCPYSLRGRDRPWAAAPRTWSELSEPDLRQLLYSEVAERFAADGDLLAGLDPAPAPAPALGDGGEVIDLGRYRRERSTRSRPLHSSAPPAPAVPAPSTVVAGPVRPMLAVDEPIEELAAQDWAFEGKWDGYRVIVRVSGGRLRVQSRSGLDLTADHPELAELAGLLSGHDVVLDGELVAVNAAGRTDFALLAARHRDAEEPRIELRLFDVLWLDGSDLSSRPWEQRRTVLEGLSGLLDGSAVIVVPELVDGDGAEALATARRLGWEGVVAKRRSAPYRPGRRSPDWRKQKNWNDVEVVIGGYRPGRGDDAELGSLLLGLPEADGLRYVGRVGTGFSRRQAADLLARLQPLRIRACPFTDRLDRPVASGAVWVLPTLVAEVRFLDWTSTGHLRHPSWRGLRPDKLPGDL